MEPTGLSSQQKRYSGKTGLSAITAYRDFMTGGSSLFFWLSFELYEFFLSWIPGVFGYIARRLVLPLFLRSCGGKITVGKGVSLRQPNNISLGRGVILDDFSLLDYRSTESSREQGGGIILEDNVLIGRGSLVVSKGGTVHLRRGCNVSSGCRIATQSVVEIGEGVLVAAFCYIGPGNHTIDDLSRPIIEQPMEIRGGVSIGQGAWIGAHTTIVDGVTIGKNAVIGANSLVLSDVPENAIAAGSPAKVIRFRTSVDSSPPVHDGSSA